MEGWIQGGANGHGGDNRPDVGLEQIGTHSSRVSDIIANIICYYTWISGVILRNMGLDFAHKICSNISTLGVNTTSYPCKQSHRTGSHGKAIDNLRIFGEKVKQSDSNNAKGCHRDPHHCTSLEGNGQSSRDAPQDGSLGRTHSRPSGAFHSNKSSNHRATGPAQEGKARIYREKLP